MIYGKRVQLPMFFQTEVKDVSTRSTDFGGKEMTSVPRSERNTMSLSVRAFFL